MRKGDYMEQSSEFFVYKVPADVHRRVLARQEQIAAMRGVELTKVTRAGDALRFVLDMADSAELLGIKPAQPEQAQA